MVRRRRIHPVLIFPAGLLVEKEVLGESFAVDIEGINLEVIFPVRDGSDDWPRLVAPSGPDQSVHDQLVDIPSSDNGWGYRRNDSWEVWAVVASLLATPVQNPRDAPEVKTLAEAFDMWFHRAREWILVRHRVPRVGLHYSRGTVVAGMTPTVGRWGSGGFVGVLAIAGLRGGSIAEVRAAFESASRRVGPPAQDRLLLDAQTAAVEGDNRRAVIDAGTAAEVAVATAIGTQLRRSGLDTETVDTIVSQSNGVVGLIVLFEALGGGLTVSKNRAINELAGTRNRAAHGGLRPTDAETSTAIRCAERIVTSATPLLLT